MSIIGIIGSPGVGKSFLVRQLAALNNAPAFLEGEVGTIPEEIVNYLSEDNDPVKMFDFFVRRDKEQLMKAREISSLGITSFMDGSVLSSRAYIFDEKEEVQSLLHEMVDSIESFEADFLIILTASSQKKSELFKLRGRVHEQTSDAVSKSDKVEREFLRLAKEKDNVLVLDRTDFDFNNRQDIIKIDSLIKEFIKNKN